MKLWKLSLTAVAVALVVAAAPIARANYIDWDPNPNVLDGIYTFAATDGQTSLDGSWVKFQNDIIVDWWLNNSSVPPGGYPWLGSTLPLTPSNSDFSPDPNNYRGTFDNDVWYFMIESNDIGTYYYDQFSGSNNANGAPPGEGSLYSGWGDPIGVWNFTPTGSVPDASDTLQLLVCALTALGVCRYFLFGRAASRS
jgi:hypothetical protein